MPELTSTSRFQLENRQLPEAVLTEPILTMAAHASVRHYKPDPVPPEALEAILTAARSASTSSNLQMYSIIVVTDAQRRQELAALTGQEHVGQAPLLLVFCPDLYRLERVCQRQGYPFADRHTEMFIQAVVDAAIAGQNAAVAAESLGLGICYIGSIRNRPLEVARLLKLPPRTFALFGMTIGYPARQPRLKPRLPAEVTVHWEEYSDAGLEEGLAAYDAIMAATGIYKDREVAVPKGAGGSQGQAADGEPAAAAKLYGWCEHTARRMAQPHPLRRDMKQYLEQLGWEF
ncbi:MAG TPA: NADPH-dependent oxidoreductase [Limnochordales bacterium]